MKFLGPPSSGSIAGTTSSHNRAGQYTRNRRSPVQPVGTGRRAFIRSAFGASSAAWSTISPTNMAAWESFAAGHPVTDSLGQSIILTGQQMYVRCSTSALNCGGTPSATPPGTVALPDVTPSTFAFSVATGISIAGFTGDPSDFAVVAVSRTCSAGVSFMKTFWQPLGADGYAAADSSPYTLTSAKYGAQFGAPVVGQKVFTRITPVNAFGWNGTPVIISTVVVA